MHFFIDLLCENVSNFPGVKLKVCRDVLTPSLVTIIITMIIIITTTITVIIMIIIIIMQNELK